MFKIISFGGFGAAEDFPSLAPANRFRPEDAATDEEGNQVCPVCGCCSLIEKFNRRYFPYNMVCGGGCKRNRRHGARQKFTKTQLYTRGWISGTPKSGYAIGIMDREGVQVTVLRGKTYEETITEEHLVLDKLNRK